MALTFTTTVAAAPDQPNLLDIRTRLIKESGRYDLIGQTLGSPDYAIDAGADNFINDALRELCRRHPFLCSQGSWTGTLAIGAYQLSPTNLRLAERVNLRTATVILVDLAKTTKQVLENEYLVPLSTVTQGTPARWCDVDGSPSGKCDTVIVIPPTDAQYTTTVEGLYYVDDLVQNTDTNRLTLVHSDILICMTRLMMAASLGNTAQMEHFEGQLARLLRGPRVDDVKRRMGHLYDAEGNLNFSR